MYQPEKPIGGYFNDIDGHWAQEWVEKLAEEEIVTGDPSGSFRPDDPITRAEAAVLINRAMQRKIGPQKGLAFVHGNLFPDDPTILGCSWSYNWGLSGDVPMSGKGDITGIPTDYGGYLLLFNEPNNPEPYGRDIDPRDGAAIYKQVKEALPRAKLVVGGISAFCDVAGFGSAHEWAIPFLDECDVLGVERPERWHIHGYVESWITADNLIDWWRRHRQLTGAVYWVTEYGTPGGTPEDFRRLTNFIKSCGWIERYAAFTNRVNGSEPWLPPGWESVSLLDYDTGELTEVGQIYADA